MKFALLKERKVSGDKRVLFSPAQLSGVIKKYRQHEFVVESSPTRCFTDKEYTDLEIKVTSNISDADILLGIKEVPIKDLIKGKTYFFFSHTTKKQPHNKEYLRGLKNKNITFFDYENFTDTNHRRLVAFGKSAGQIGAYHAIRTYGIKHHLFKLPNPYQCDTLEELVFFASNVSLPPVKIVTTGTGNVGKGIADFFEHVGIQKVNPLDFLNNQSQKAIFTQLGKKEYLKDGKNQEFNIKNFIANPGAYQSDFIKYAKHADVFVAGHYYHKNMPMFFKPKELLSPEFKINTIADISCDIGVPLPTCIRVSTPKNPIYGYHKLTGKETDFLKEESIAVMAVDNLPCELPKTSSIDFGNQFTTNILPYMGNDLNHPVIQKACVLQQGVFTKRYEYLNGFLANEKYQFTQ